MSCSSSSFEDDLKCPPLSLKGECKFDVVLVVVVVMVVVVLGVGVMVVVVQL